MSRVVTFVLIGSRQGASLNIGPSGRYKFRGGELKVAEHDVSAMTRALSHYAAYPKGDAEPFHKALCAKQGIDPVTLSVLPEEPAEEHVKAVDPVGAPEPATVEESLTDAIGEILKGIDHTDDKCWTASGTVSVFWVNEQLPDKEGASRKLLDTFNITRNKPA